jgi:hypothetical protein
MYDGMTDSCSITARPARRCLVPGRVVAVVSNLFTNNAVPVEPMRVSTA